MSEFSGIADLPTMTDDLDVPYDAESYVDQSSPLPLAPGTYRFKALKVSARKDKAGALVLADGKYPTLVLEQVSVVEPVENARAASVWQDIRTKPQMRKDPRTGTDKPANDLFDIVRSYDAQSGFDGIEGAKQRFQQHAEQGDTFRAEIGWEANDADYVKAEFAKLEALGTARKDVSKDVASAIYNTARKRTKDFKVGGVLVPSVLGPSGNMLEARAKIVRYIPSTELDSKVKLGPRK